MSRKKKTPNRTRHAPVRQRPVPRRRLPENLRYSGVGEAMKDGTFSDLPENTQIAAKGLITHYLQISKTAPHGPACGGPLFIHTTGDVSCTADCPGALEVLHVPEAMQLCRDADEFGGMDYRVESCDWCTTTGGGSMDTCAGTEIDHQDGTVSCTLGAECAGANAVHINARTCGLFEPCEPCGITTAAVPMTAG